ncbi:MAG: amidase family protein, partial [Puniceicoccales bacterium]
MTGKTITQWRELANESPVRAAEAFFENLQAVSREDRNKAVWWKPTREALASAFARATALDSPIAGVPYGLKDLFDFAGAPTTAGSGFLPDVRPTPERDSRMVRFLSEHGGVMACKTATVEFAYGLSGENHWFGDCPHPSIPGALSGGSSSGSAWIVGAGVTPFAIGTDTAGSMRVPAAYCGVYSWRNSPGPIGQEGCVPLAISFDTPGWFAQSAED